MKEQVSIHHPLRRTNLHKKSKKKFLLSKGLPLNTLMDQSAIYLERRRNVALHNPRESINVGGKHFSVRDCWCRKIRNSLRKKVK